MEKGKEYDVIVIGAGHAGCEAALAAARMGAKAALFTMNKDKAAAMPCNPAIGGLAKGQVVREIDALGGEMAKAADATCIQFKVLNPKKGPAVRGLRAQADKREYTGYMKKKIKEQENLDFYGAAVTEITVNDKGVSGIIAGRVKYPSKTVVVTTGTFLNGVIYIGFEETPAGMLGEPPSVALSSSLKKLGFKMGRLKTGTPQRVERESLDYSKFTEQPGDPDPVPFSFSTEELKPGGVMCWLTNTNEKTKKVIEDNLERSPLYSKSNKKIFGAGPRYCPSIEDKIVKFPEKTAHHVFIEPEWKGSNEMYLNGLSTSLPPDVQEAYLKTIPGFENIKIISPAYGIEYDFSYPSQIRHTMEAKCLPDLFFAGQINGTSGYEEAAGQGLLAGINAALKVKGEPPFVTPRSESYIGVMTDDLINLDINEPYRLFSSRAEYRLILRNDNADVRLSRYGRKFGLVDDEDYSLLMRKKEFFIKEKERFGRERIEHSEENRRIMKEAGAGPLSEGMTLLDVLKRPGAGRELLRKFTDTGRGMPSHFTDYLLAEIKYEGYIKKQERQVKKFEKLEKKRIPPGFDYEKTKGLSGEAKQKLAKIKPETIGQASRIYGVRSADVNVLLVLLKKYGRNSR